MGMEKSAFRRWEGVDMWEGVDVWVGVVCGYWDNVCAVFRLLRWSVCCIPVTRKE